MARATAFPSSISAVMMGSGKFTAKGIVPSEDAFDAALYKLMLRELKKKGIVIKELTM